MAAASLGLSDTVAGAANVLTKVAGCYFTDTGYLKFNALLDSTSDAGMDVANVCRVLPTTTTTTTTWAMLSAKSKCSSQSPQGFWCTIDTQTKCELAAAYLGLSDTDSGYATDCLSLVFQLFHFGFF